MPLETIVVAGASLAGLRGSEALREAGYEGRLVVIGAEPHLPYDRPPLSKEVLAGTWDPERTALRPAESYADLAIEWRLGRRAVGLDPAAHTVLLDDGERVQFDGLLIATGARARALRGGPPLAGTHTLRTLDDCLALRAALDKTPRVCVVGAGFIGAEVAATCRARGLEVTLVEALVAPLARALGPSMGRVLAELHHDHGVAVRCGVGVAALEGRGHIERVRLVDGSAIAADRVVVGIGVEPETDWLEGSGLPIQDGVCCDATCATPVPGIVAAGDVARWRNPRFGTTMRVEHWTNAVEQGMAAATRLLAGAAAEPYAPVPFFWSDQYGVKIRFAGVARPDDEIRVVHGSTAERRFVALFGRAGRLTGVLAFDRSRLLMRYRRRIAEGTAWEDALREASATE